MQFVPGWFLPLLLISMAFGAVFHGVAAIIRAYLSGQAEIIRAKRGLPEPKESGGKVLRAREAD